MKELDTTALCVPFFTRFSRSAFEGLFFFSEKLPPTVSTSVLMEMGPLWRRLKRRDLHGQTSILDDEEKERAVTASQTTHRL